MAHSRMFSFKITSKIALDLPNEPLCPVFEMQSNFSVQFHPILKRTGNASFLVACVPIYYYIIKSQKYTKNSITIS